MSDNFKGETFLSHYLSVLLSVCMSIFFHGECDEFNCSAAITLISLPNFFLWLQEKHDCCKELVLLEIILPREVLVYGSVVRTVPCGSVVGVEIYIILMFFLHKVAFIYPSMAAD